VAASADDISHIGRLLQSRATRFPDRAFVAFGGMTYSYGEAARAANCVAHGLRRLGVRKGDAVAIMFSNCPEFVFAWLGVVPDHVVPPVR